MGAFARADEDVGELCRVDQFVRADEYLSCAEDLLDAVFCEVQLCVAGVAAFFRPFGFPCVKVSEETTACLWFRSPWRTR